MRKICWKRLCAFMLALLLALTGLSGAFADEEEKTFISLSDYWNQKNGGEDPEPEPGGDDEPLYNTAYQMTEDDIFRMNGGDAAVLYTDGYLTFLRGRYCEEKVTDAEEAVASLSGMASLLGLGRGAEFYAVFVQTNSYGYTCYTFMQRYGDLTLQNAVLKVITDPEGYTAGLISSFTPNVGFAPENEVSITPEEAVSVVRDLYPEEEMTYFPQYTRQTSVTIGGVAYHAWAVFTTYPAGRTAPDGRAYIEHLVAYDGTYLMYMAVSSPEELVLGDNAQNALSLEWFEGMEPDTYTGTVTLHDGTVREITVPVVRDRDGVYYLADAQRHILLTDCYSYLYDGYRYAPFTSADNTGWPEHYLLTYESYIKVYDFYASYGYRSVDGFGVPMLILTDYCDEFGDPVNNACYMGISAGWALFAASTLNDFGESVDVCAHEFTHGVTTYAMAGDLYENQPGAVNEALSDIMGNLCEMLLGETEDTEWLLAETSGWTVRSMSFPWAYEQPVSIGGLFYEEEAEEPTVYNDLGGVHTNSSLVAHVAWQLCMQGMSLNDAFCLWMDAIDLLTPYSGYREVHQALLFAAEMRGMDVMWLGRIEMACEQAGF